MYVCSSFDVAKIKLTHCHILTSDSLVSFMQFCVFIMFPYSYWTLYMFFLCWNIHRSLIFKRKNKLPTNVVHKYKRLMNSAWDLWHWKTQIIYQIFDNLCRYREKRECCSLNASNHWIFHNICFNWENNRPYLECAAQSTISMNFNIHRFSVYLFYYVVCRINESRRL